MIRRDFKQKKGFFNGQTMTAFLWRNNKGNFTSLVEPSAKIGNKSYSHSFNLQNGVNIFVNYNTKANFILAKITITGDNSRDGKFTTFFGKVVEEIKFNEIDNSYTHRGTTNNEFKLEGKRVGLFFTRSCELQSAIADCKDGYDCRESAKKSRLKKILESKDSPLWLKNLAEKKLG